jgi:hypothetical protein
MTTIQRAFVFLLVASMVTVDFTEASGQLKFFTWFRERIGERKAKEPDKAKEDSEWQKKHFASPAAQQEFIAAVKKAQCNTCHVKGKEKQTRNPFGTRLSELLQAQLHMDSKTITDNLKNTAPPDVQQKMLEAFYGCLDQALQMPVDSENSSSGTFGERMRTGQPMVSS